MTIKRICALVLVLLLLEGLFSGVSANGNLLSLDNAVEAALANSPEITKYNNAITKLERQYREAVVSSRNIEDLLNSIHKESLSEEEKYELNLSSQLNDDNIEYIINTNKAMLQLSKNNIVLQLNQLFMQWRKINGSINNQNLLISSLERNLYTAKTKLALGKVSTKSVEQLGIKLQSAKVELNNLKRQKSSIEISINKLTDEPVNKRYDEYTINKQMPSLNPGNADNYVAAAIDNRLDIKAALKLYEVKKSSFDITKQYYYFDTNINNKSAWIDMNDALDKLESTKLQAQIQVLNAYEQLESQLNTIESNKQAMEASLSRYNEAQKKINMGLVTELELSNAQIEYIKSKDKYESSLNDGWYKKLQLDNACGTKLYSEL